MSSLGIVDHAVLGWDCVPVPPSPGSVQHSLLEQGAQALSSMQLTFLSGKRAEEGASKLPGQKQSCWEQENLSVNHKADTFVGASSFPVKWYFEGLGVPLTALSSLRVPCNPVPFLAPISKAADVCPRSVPSPRHTLPVACAVGIWHEMELPGLGRISESSCIASPCPSLLENQIPGDVGGLGVSYPVKKLRWCLVWVGSAAVLTPASPCKVFPAEQQSGKTLQ